MNIGLEAGHTYHIRLVVDDTIGTLYVDGVALNVRMYERPGESLGVFATDGTVEVRNASIARGLKRKWTCPFRLDVTQSAACPYA